MRFCTLRLARPDDLIGECQEHGILHSVWIATDPSPEAERWRRRLDDLPTSNPAPGALPPAPAVAEPDPLLVPHDSLDGAEASHRLAVVNRGSRRLTLLYRDEGGNEVELAVVPAFKSVMVDAADGSAWVVRGPDSEIVAATRPLRQPASVEVR